MAPGQTKWSWEKANSWVTEAQLKVGAVLGALMLANVALQAILWGSNRNWTIGASLTVVYGVLLVLLLRALRSVREEPVWVMLANIVIAVSLAAIVVASLSFLLVKVGAASYRSNWPIREQTLSYFTIYFHWLFLDMLPAVRVTEVFGSAVPMEPENLVARLTVLSFRVVVTFGIFNAVTRWWPHRKGAQDRR